MQHVEVLEQVQAIIRTELEDESIRITDATVMDDVPGWDSVAHIRIVVAVESRFGILLDPGEYMEIADVGEMVNSVSAKLVSKSLVEPTAKAAAG